LQHLDDVNMEIINNFKDIWEKQSKLTANTARMEGVVHG